MLVRWVACQVVQTSAMKGYKRFCRAVRESKACVVSKGARAARGRVPVEAVVLRSTSDSTRLRKAAETSKPHNRGKGGDRRTPTARFLVITSICRHQTAEHFSGSAAATPWRRDRRCPGYRPSSRRH